MEDSESKEVSAAVNITASPGDGYTTYEAASTAEDFTLTITFTDSPK